MNLSVKKEPWASQTRRAAEDHWQPFKEPWERQLSVSAPRWVVSYMWLTHLRLQRWAQTNSIWVRKSGRHVENPRPSSEEVSSPSQRLYVTFWGPSSVKKLLRLPLVNKLLGLDAHTKRKRVTRCLLCSKPKRTLQKTANQEPLRGNKRDRNSAANHWSSELFSQHLLQWTMQVCIVLPSRRQNWG